MSNAIVCPGCQRQFHDKPELAGKRIRCPKCDERFIVPMPVQPIADHWQSDSGSFDFSTLAPPATAEGVPPMAHRQVPPPLTYRTPTAANSWTPNQLQCRRIGLRLGIFGAVGMVLPFMGLQFTLLSVLGGYAILGALVLFLVGWCLFAGAYLIRTQWCGGDLAALKIGGVLAAGVVAVLIFMMGALVLGILGVRQFKRPATSALAGAGGVTSVTTSNPIQPTHVSGPTVNPTVNSARQTPAFNRPRPGAVNDPSRAALDQLQMQLQGPTAPQPAQAPRSHKDFDLALTVTGLDAIPGDHNARIKQLLAKVTPMQENVPGEGKGWSVSGPEDDSSVNVVVHPVKDFDGALRMIDFGTAQVDPRSPHHVTVKIDPAKFASTAAAH